MQEAIKHIGQSKPNFLAVIHVEIRRVDYYDNISSLYTIIVKESIINSSNIRIANTVEITSEKQHIGTA